MKTQTKPIGLFRKISTSEIDAINIILQQWITSYEMAIQVTKMQISTNNVFTAILSILLGGLLVNYNSSNLSTFKTEIMICVSCIIGIVLCIVWIFQLVYLKNLNKKKYDIIRKLESKLPASVLTMEYITIYRGNESYFSKMQTVVPISFLAGFIIIGVISFL